MWIGLSYGTTVDEGHVAAVEALGLPVELVVPAVDALLLGQVDASMIPTLRALDDVVMVEAYGELVFWGDVQTPAVKASSSSVYQRARGTSASAARASSSPWWTPAWTTNTLD